MAQPTIEQFQLGAIDATQLNGENADHYESYDIAMFKEGKVTTPGDQLARFQVPRDMQIPANFVGSVAGSRTITAAVATYNITFNTVPIGLVTFAAGASTGTIAVTGSPGPFLFVSGDFITFDAVTADANQEDISIVIKGEVR